MANIYFDFETRSAAELTKVGLYNYLKDPYAEILCLAYRIGMDSTTQLWMPFWSPTAPDVFRKPEDHFFYAHNIQFDAKVIEFLGGKYGFKKLEWRQCIDVMALAARYGYPRSLKNLTNVLNVKEKNTSGTRLINRITKPCSGPDEPVPRWEFTSDDMKEFMQYCKDDVDAMCEAIQALPTDTLSMGEQKIWENTCRINEYGIPLDLDMAYRIGYVTQQYVMDQTEKLPELTDGEVTKVTQVARIKNWANTYGAGLVDLSKESIDDFLENPPPEIPEEVITVIGLRKIYNKTSVAKYTRMVDFGYKGRVHNCIEYFGGHTGRETSRGVQIHNLPKDRYKDPEKVLDRFRDLSILDWTEDSEDDNPMTAAKKLIRSMIKAPQGKYLIVLDYAQIEFRVLMWLVGHHDVLNKLRKDEDIYKEFAALLYKTTIDKITDSQRNFGKTVVLGSGYSMGSYKLFMSCKSYGLNVTPEECDEAIELFRSSFDKVKRAWYALQRSAISAVLRPGAPIAIYKCIFLSAYDRAGNFWLTVKLPSGRKIFYHKPLVRRSGNHNYLTYWGVNGTTKKWEPLELNPGKITENIVQATARDILMHGRNEIMACDPGLWGKVIASVHDENIIEVDENYVDLAWDKINYVMETQPEWCKGLPLKVTGYSEERYRKD